MMSFSLAVCALKEGKKVARKNWNGKEMYLYKAVVELPYPPLSENVAWVAGTFGNSEFIIMKTADNKLIPWLASQTDLLADDWIVVE